MVVVTTCGGDHVWWWGRLLIYNVRIESFEGKLVLQRSLL
jgi:hypothetical protein